MKSLTGIFKKASVIILIVSLITSTLWPSLIVFGDTQNFKLYNGVVPDTRTNIGIIDYFSNLRAIDTIKYSVTNGKIKNIEVRQECGKFTFKPPTDVFNLFFSKSPLYKKLFNLSFDVAKFQLEMIPLGSYLDIKNNKVITKWKWVASGTAFYFIKLREEQSFMVEYVLYSNGKAKDIKRNMFLKISSMSDKNFNKLPIYGN
jgi:hypothetical protein